MLPDTFLLISLGGKKVGIVPSDMPRLFAIIFPLIHQFDHALIHVP